MKRDYFFEMGFRGLTLLFWPIIIYKWIFISNFYIERNCFLAFSFLAILYILIIGISQIKNKFLDNIVIYYRIATLSSFILTLASFLLFPSTNTSSILPSSALFCAITLSFTAATNLLNLWCLSSSLT